MSQRKRKAHVVKTFPSQKTVRNERINLWFEPVVSVGAAVIDRSGQSESRIQRLVVFNSVIFFLMKYFLYVH